MPRTALIAALVVTSTACAPLAQADYRESRRGSDYYDYAQVLDVKPLVEVVQVPYDRQECWDEEVAHRQPGGVESYAPTIIGGVAGGALGTQVGKGKGRDAAIIAGTLLGGAVANNLYGNRAPPTTYNTIERRCRTVTSYREEERVRSYRVTYRYHGQVYRTTMDHDPGERLRVDVSVRPGE